MSGPLLPSVLVARINPDRLDSIVGLNTMPLSAGTRLGVYEILSPLGAGGMGEVYRAKDTKLGRDVALKILPKSFTNDPERVARFRREAQVLASLNHPHIAQIYGLEEANRAQFIVLELVDGESLDKRIAGGPIPVEEALGIARQIAEALEAAHEKGVIHRDLKPANLALTKEGNVKVLDFGLAKAVERTSGSMDAMNSPTITSPAKMTGVGVILGTAAYMSPEQAKGFPADHRSDIFSFGVVLHEMLIGRPPFQGETVAEILASVLMREPDLSALPPDLNPRLAELLLRCLAKHPKKRWQAVGDLGAELQAISAAPHAVPPVSLRPRPLWRRAFPILASVFVGSVLTGVVVWLLKPSPVTPHLVRFTVTPSGVLPLPTGGRGAASPYRDLVLSPDGKRVIYNVGTVGAGDNDPQLWVRAFDQLDGAQLPGIVGNATGFPFMSPDGQWIAFYWGGELRKVSIFGGPPILLCRVPGGLSGFRGGSWGPDNRIIFASNDAATGLFSVPATGGDATVLTRPDREHGEQDHLFPWVLPGGRAALFTIVQNDGSMETAVIAALDLRTSQRKVLVRGGTAAQYVDGGYLVYASAGSLRAVRFDPARLEVLSDPVLVVDSVLTKPNGAAEFSVSHDGTLAYVGGDAQTTVQRALAWVDRQGREEPIAAPLRSYLRPRLSPDGTRVAVDATDQENDVWVWDLARRTLRRLTFDPGADTSPVWTPDSRGILFSSTRGGNMFNEYRQAADGTGAIEPLPEQSEGLTLTSIAPDGMRAVGQAPLAPTKIMVMTFGEQPHVEPLIQTKFITRNAEISADGRWVAYESSESARPEVYVRPFPNVDSRSWQVSTQGGTKPLWAPNGRELFYIDADGFLTAVPVRTATTFTAGSPARLLQTRYFSGSNARTYDVSGDGQRFLMIKESIAGVAAQTPSIVVVLNWVEELKAKLPVK